jgi:hypothetical protein
LDFEFSAIETALAALFRIGELSALPFSADQPLCRDERGRRKMN